VASQSFKTAGAPADNHSVFDYERSTGSSRDCEGGDVDLSFAVFSLTHAGCGDGLMELRLGERLLLEWCPVCASMVTFGLPGERSPGPEDRSLA
jgi:hypothetical protein